MEMTIKDVMERLGMTVHTVRHYCDCGLVPDLGRDEHGNRVFDEESLKWLGMAKFLRSCDVPVKQVKRYFDLCEKGDATARERLGFLEQLRDDAKEKAQKAQQRYEYLDERVEHVRQVLDGGKADDSNPLNWRSGVECPL